MLLVPALLAGCADDSSVEAARRDGLDLAYVSMRAKSDGCPSSGPSPCCETLRADLDAALKADQMMAAADAIEGLGAACPADRTLVEEALRMPPLRSVNARQELIVQARYEIK